MFDLRYRPGGREVASEQDAVGARVRAPPGARVVLGVHHDRARRPADVGGQRRHAKAHRIGRRQPEELADAQVLFGRDRLGEHEPPAGAHARFRLARIAPHDLARGQQRSGLTRGRDHQRPSLAVVQQPAAVERHRANAREALELGLPRRRERAGLQEVVGAGGGDPHIC